MKVYLKYALLVLILLKISCADQKKESMDVVRTNGALHQQPTTGQIKRFWQNGVIKLYMVSSNMDAIEVQVLDDRQEFIRIMHLLGYTEIPSDEVALATYLKIYDKSVAEAEYDGIKFHVPIIRFASSTDPKPEPEDVSAYLVDGDNDTKQVLLYFYREDELKLYRPGCEEVYHEMGIEDQDIVTKTDPRDLLTFYFDLAEDQEIDIVNIPCGKKDAVSSTFKWTCDDDSMDGQTKSTIERLLNIAGNQSDCQEAQNYLENSISEIDLSANGNSTENDSIDLSPLSSFDTSNIESLNLSGNETMQNLEAIKDLRNLEQLNLDGCGLSTDEIEKILANTTEETCTASLNYLKSLNLANNKLDNIDFLDCGYWIEKLNVAGNRLNENIDSCDSTSAILSPLANASLLKYLNIGDNEIVCLNPLSSAYKLIELVANDNKITSVSPLKNLTELDTLNVSNSSWIKATGEAVGNKIADLRMVPTTVLSENLNAGNNPIEYMRGLDDWCMHRDRFSPDGFDGRKATIDAIYAARGVEENDAAFCSTTLNEDLELSFKLSLYNMNITNLAPLSALENLEKLQLGENQIKTGDLKPLDALSNLNWLDLSGNDISGISPLVSLKNLEYLNVSQNRLDSIGSEICALSNLTRLDISNNNGQNLLQENTFVSRQCAIKDVLEWLNISNTSFSGSTNPLSYLTNIERLYLSEVSLDPAEDLSFLANGNFDNLKHLDISSSGKDLTLSNLSGLTNLQSLSVRDLGVSDISAIGNKEINGKQNLPSLKHVELFGNEVEVNDIDTYFENLDYLDVREQKTKITTCPILGVGAGCYFNQEESN